MNLTTPRPTVTAPVFCERCEMVEPRLVADPHRCRLCGAVCCLEPVLGSPQATAAAAKLAGRAFRPPLPVDATLRAVRQRRRLFYP